MTSTKKPCLFHVCESCDGKGVIEFYHHEVSCRGCNGYGGRIEFCSIPRMQEWLDAQPGRS